MKFESIFLIILLNKQTLSFISKLAKYLSQGKSIDGPHDLLILLMMAVLVKRRVDTGTHHDIWLRGEDKFDTVHRFSLNVSRFINNLL